MGKRLRFVAEMVRESESAPQASKASNYKLCCSLAVIISKYFHRAKTFVDRMF